MDINALESRLSETWVIEPHFSRGFSIRKVIGPKSRSFLLTHSPSAAFDPAPRNYKRHNLQKIKKALNFKYEILLCCHGVGSVVKPKEEKIKGKGYVKLNVGVS